MGFDKSFVVPYDGLVDRRTCLLMRLSINRSRGLCSHFSLTAILLVFFVCCSFLIGYGRDGGFSNSLQIYCLFCFTTSVFTLPLSTNIIVSILYNIMLFVILTGVLID